MKAPRRISLARLAVLTLAAAALSPPAAFAHVFPESETPSADATLTATPSEVTIRFDGPVEPMFAKVQVLDGAGVSVAAGASALSDDHRVLGVHLQALSPGSYTVSWSVVAEDSHRTEGSYIFTVSGKP